jgi:hypothetical protein
VLLLVSVAVILRTKTVELLAGRPRAVVALFGLFWWLFLWPSAVGWLIVALAVLWPHLISFARRIGSRWPTTVRRAT